LNTQFPTRSDTKKRFAEIIPLLFGVNSDFAKALRLKEVLPKELTVLAGVRIAKKDRSRN
jgi:hypothetical protein